MFSRYYKFIFLSLFIFSLLIPQVSLSASDTRCWKKTECEKVDSNGLSGIFYGPNDETEKACEKTKDASGVEIGFCSPAGDAKTEIGFSESSSFSNMGEFIKWLYRYGIQISSILAVIMVIVAGVQWSTSAGNSEAISSAKKRIGGALMGLFLISLSYFILNQVNPYLINLRMPKMWKINKLGLAPPICSQITDGRLVAASPGGTYDIDPAKTTCGVEYYVENTGDLSCKGISCSSPTDICRQFKLEFINATVGNKEVAGAGCYDSSKAPLSVYLKLESLLQDTVKGNWFVGQVTNVVESPFWLDRGANDGAKIYVRCASGKVSSSNYNLSFNGSGADGYNAFAVSQVGSKQLANYNFFLEYKINSSTFEALDSKCPDGKAVSFYIRHEIKLAGCSKCYDPNFYLSPASAGGQEKVLIGSWPKISKYPGFSIEKLKAGSIFGTATMSGSVITDISENPSS